MSVIIGDMPRRIYQTSGVPLSIKGTNTNHPDPITWESGSTITWENGEPIEWVDNYPDVLDLAFKFEIPRRNFVGGIE